MNFAAFQSMMSGSKGGAPNLNLGGGGRGGGPSAAAAAASAAGGGNGGATPAELKVHADNMWKMLDELASSDPEGYKKFVAGQMDAMAAEKARQAETEAMFTPHPAFVVYTKQVGGSTAAKGGASGSGSSSSGADRTIYLNICSSAQVPGLQTKDRKPATGHESMSDILIPLSVGGLKVARDAATGAEVHTSDIVFHPSVVQRSTVDLAFKLFMLELALQHLEEDEKIQLHRGYKFIPPSTTMYMGGDAQGKPLQQRTEAEIAREKFLVQMKKDREEKIKNMATKPAGEVLMPSLAKQTQAREQYEEQETIKELKLRPEAAAPAAGGKPAPKKVLIEDLTPDQGEDPSLAPQPVKSAAKPVAAASASSSSSSAAAKPAISLASSIKLTSSSSSSSSASTAASTSAAASTAAAAAVPSSSPAAAAAVESDAAWSSKASSAISSEDFLSSLASIPVQESASPWPYGSKHASMQSTDSIAAPGRTTIVTPTHRMSVVNGQLEISIDLPLVNSVSELDVDVSRTQLQLSSLHYALTLTFPVPICDDHSAAKFVKKQHTLKIQAPVQ